MLTRRGRGSLWLLGGCLRGRGSDGLCVEFDPNEPAKAVTDMYGIAGQVARHV